MAGFLNDIGLDSVEADPNYIADGKYPAKVTKSEIKPKKGSTSNQWILTYTIQGGQASGKSQSEFFDLNPTGDNAALKKSFLKRRVLSLGVPENEVNNVDSQFFVGLDVVIEIKHKGTYQNVVDLELASSSPAASTGISAPVNDAGGFAGKM